MVSKTKSLLVAPSTFYFFCRCWIFFFRILPRRSGYHPSRPPPLRKKNCVNKTHKNSVLNAGSECTCIACMLLHHPGVYLLLWLDLAVTLMNLEKILLGLNVLRAGAGVSLPSWIHVTCRQAVRLIGRFCGGALAASCSLRLLGFPPPPRPRSRSPQADWKPSGNSPVKA